MSSNPSRTKMRFLSKSLSTRSDGFSLVEVMVGLVIGMLAAIVILQVFAMSGAQQRSASGSGDAQSNGAIVFYQMQQNLSQGGFGFAVKTILNCKLKWAVSST